MPAVAVVDAPERTRAEIIRGKQAEARDLARSAASELIGEMRLLSLSLDDAAGWEGSLPAGLRDRFQRISTFLAEEAQGLNVIMTRVPGHA